jgi:hypothetical protein
MVGSPLTLATFPTTDNTKNEVLHYYVVANGSGGSSVFSLGELSGSGFGTSPVNVNVSAGGQVSLTDTAQSARNVSNLTSLQIYAVAALAKGAGGQSTSVNVSGGGNPGNYNLSQLQSFPVTQTSVPNSAPPPTNMTYTGSSLSTFLGLGSLSSTDLLNDIVITEGTDGYLVVLAAAELAQSLGGNPNDIMAYASDGGDFPGSGVARTILPTDAKHGRWMSNLDEIDVVAATPLPSTWVMMLTGFAGLGLVGFYRRRKGGALAVA